MRRKDTIDYGPSKLILRQTDLDNYFSHRRRLTDMQPMVDAPRQGEHIKRINFGKTEMNLSDRNRRIESENRILFEKIRGIMERPAYVNATLFDSQAMAQQALNASPSSGMQVQLNQTMDYSDSKLEGKLIHQSNQVLPQKRIKSNRLSVSPKRLKVFHFHNIGQDNGIMENIKDNRLQIQVGANLTRIMHNQRQDHSHEIMN